MAKKIGVLAVHQPENCQPRTFVKKSIAQLLVRRLLAEQLSRNVIRMLQLGAIKPVKAAEFIEINNACLPCGDLPPLEVPGVFFCEPEYATWRKPADRAVQEYFAGQSSTGQTSPTWYAATLATGSPDALQSSTPVENLQ